MLKTAAMALGVLTFAIAGGGASVWYALGQMTGPAALRTGVWTAYPELGSAEADPYSKAAIARDAVLPLGPAEGLAFYADRDSTGIRLSGRCTYRLEGTVPLARLWTLHVRSADASRHASPGLHSMAIIHRDDNGVEITAAPTPMPGNWLRTGNLREMTLVLTLYDTPVAGRASRARISLPEVTRLGCRGQGPSAPPADRQDGMM
ncbi:DUF1214 domain-containing protein [Mesorhizobium xinjiangense]|uniref:DUF1214 domain-containing protein n=1 Tax=Mesorhizobium xinjiangense TaxID=2678685 RepID=UPI0012EE61BD|nr:DUF1214 domain-containing protein [Mesorhizobium xinjiangense]